MYAILSLAIVLFGCGATYYKDKLYVQYIRAIQGTLVRLQLGHKARFWSYVSIITWSIATITEASLGHHFSMACAAFNAFVSYLIHKAHDFDDLDPFGSKLKKKIKSFAISTKKALTPKPGRSLAPTPI